MATKNYPQAVDVHKLTLWPTFIHFISSVSMPQETASHSEAEENNANNPISSGHPTRGENTCLSQVGSLLGSDINSKYRRQEKEEDIPLEMSWKN